MAGFDYPVDVQDLVRRLESRGGDTLARLGIKAEDRDDQKLTAIAWGVGHGAFPVMADGKTFHPGVDLGLPEVASNDPDSWYGAPVFAISDGECIYTESGTRTPDGYDLGRVVLRHQTPDGNDVYAVYQHLNVVSVVWGGFVKQGEVVGQVGWHGDFPHVHVGICSPGALGGDRDLGPEAAKGKLPEGDGVWNILRVKTDELDENDWPNVPSGPAYIYNPIELIRWTRGEEYLHDIGDGHLSRLQLSGNPAEHESKPGEDNAHKIESHLTSKVLGSCAKLVELSHDFGFSPIGRGHPDKEVVKAIQSCFKLLGHDVGRFGPNHDGIDGDFGKTCERIVKKFQAALKGNDKLLAALGHTADDVPEDGAIDCLTLLAMDAGAAALEANGPEEKPEPAPAPKADAPAQKRPDVPVAAAPPSAWIFDATTKKQSMAFGLRMYQALMRWRWDKDGNGTGYSAAAEMDDLLVYRDEYYSVIKQKDKGRTAFPEWPLMDAFPFLPPEGTIERNDGTRANIYFAFGCSWVASGFTNCCNSQLAALLVALGSRDIFVRKDGKDVAYWAGPNDLKKYPDKSDQVIEVPGTKGMEAMRAFEHVIVGNYGNIVKPDSRGSGVLGCQLIGLGDAIPLGDGKPYDGKYTNEEKVLRYVRIGDWANYDHHSWLVGEVRYGIWFKGTSTDGAPDAVVDQSSFAAETLSEPVAIAKPGGVPGELSDAQCDWITQNEDEFHARCEALYQLADAGGEITVDFGRKKGTAKKQVGRVAVWRLGVFSANGLWGDHAKAIHGKVYGLDKKYWGELDAAKQEAADAATAVRNEKDAAKKKELKKTLEEKQQAVIDVSKPADRWSDQSNTDNAKINWEHRGITNALTAIKRADPKRPRERPGDPVSFARFYAHANGAPADNKLSS